MRAESARPSGPEYRAIFDTRWGIARRSGLGPPDAGSNVRRHRVCDTATEKVETMSSGTRVRLFFGGLAGTLLLAGGLGLVAMGLRDTFAASESRRPAALSPETLPAAAADGCCQSEAASKHDEGCDHKAEAGTACPGQ